jgi:hypothetical protein
MFSGSFCKTYTFLLHGAYAIAIEPFPKWRKQCQGKGCVAKKSLGLGGESF